MTNLPNALLAQRERELNLIMTLDTIRDSSGDPATMLAMIVNALADRFDADLCLLSVADRESGALELKSISHRGNKLRQLGGDEIRRLAEHAFAAKQITIWQPDEHDLPPDLFMASIPIQMGPITRLGGVVLARVGSEFSEDDKSLMRIAESQLDSAVIQGYAYYELQQRNRELEVIYRIDRIRDKRLPFDEMLNTVLVQIRDVLEAELGFIMLYNAAGSRLELRAYTHEDLFRASPYNAVITGIAQQALDTAQLVNYSNDEGDLCAVLAVPLILNESILGVFGVANRCGERQFVEEDRRLLGAIASQIDTAIFESLEQRRLRQVLGRSVDKRVMERLLENADVGFLKGERINVSVLYADIRGSTSLAERTDPELLVEYINDYLGTMSTVILQHQGTLDKFVGDEVMAVFNAPFSMQDHALRSVQTALAMQEAYAVVMREWEGRGIPPSPIGIGIATGECISGEMGSQLRTDYTVIGRAANLGARLCSAAAGDEVLISQATYDMVKDRVEAEPIMGLEVKGVAGEITAYRVVGVR